MPKTALDPNFALSTGGRNFAAVTPSDNTDLAVVSSSLIVTIGSGGTGISVIPANAPDTGAVTIPLAAGTYKLDLQVRRVMASNTNLGTGGGITALWD